MIAYCWGCMRSVDEFGLEPVAGERGRRLDGGLRGGGMRPQDAIGAALVVSIIAAAMGWLHPIVPAGLLVAYIVVVNWDFRRRFNK